MNYCHITDLSWNPRAIPSRFGDIAENYSSLPESRWLSDGWRRAVPATIGEGDVIDVCHVTFTDTEANQIIDSMRTAAEIAAAKAAAEAIRKETPLIYDQPIQSRFETPAADGHVYGLEVDPNDGAIIGIPRESKRLTPEEYAALKAATFAARKTETDKLKLIPDASGAAQSVPALREQVKLLAQIVMKLVATKVQGTE